MHFAYAPANGTSVPIFNGFSLSVAEGQLVRLIGPNGESTLLDLIAGRLSPLGGTVALDGHPPRQSPISVVYLRQKPIENVAPNLTVAENLAFATDVRRPILDWSRSATRSLQRMDERLRHFDLSITHLCPDQTVGTLSGGQVQWLALAMALLARATGSSSR